MDKVFLEGALLLRGAVVFVALVLFLSVGIERLSVLVVHLRRIEVVRGQHGVLVVRVQGGVVVGVVLVNAAAVAVNVAASGVKDAANAVVNGAVAAVVAAAAAAAVGRAVDGGGQQCRGGDAQASLHVDYV